MQIIPEWAVYDLSCNSPSFDFCTFIQYVCHRKIGKVYFKEGYNNCPSYKGIADEKKRVRNILIPLAEMAGLTYEFGKNPPPNSWPPRDEQRYIHRQKRLWEVSEPAKLTIPQAALDKVNDKFKGKNPGLVILRTQTFDRRRNSSDAWERWATEHEFQVIKDDDTEHMPLEERLAHYELASLNYGVTGGHFFPVYYSHLPYLSVVWGKTNAGNKKFGIRIGNEFPWKNKKQKIVWNNSDHYKDIEREYKAYMEENA